MKIALIGYGKMGKEIEKIALSRGHEIVSIIDVDNRQDMDSDAFRSASPLSLRLLRWHTAIAWMRSSKG